MKKLMLFYLSDCPYCHNARRALEELKKENPVYGKVDVEWIEENERQDLLGQYDYYYVPSVFTDKEKLYEAHPGESYAECKEHLQAALETACREA